MWDVLSLEVAVEFGSISQWDAITDRAHELRHLELGAKRVRESLRRIANGRKVRDETGPCRGCGKDFDRRATGRVREYCSDKCRNKAFHNSRLKHQKRVAETAVCPWCKTTFVKPAVGQMKKFCTQLCQGKAKQQRKRQKRKLIQKQKQQQEAA